MQLNKRIFQKIFKFLTYNLFKIFYGKIESVIDTEKKYYDSINVKQITLDEKFNYKVYSIKRGRLYTDCNSDTAIIKNKKIVKGPSFQFRDLKTKVINGEVNENLVFKNGTPRIKKKINGKVLSLLTGGAGNHNYWHWLFDVLPRFKLCEDTTNIGKIDYFLLPDNQKSFQIETLNLLNISKSKQISSQFYRHIIADELFITDHPYLLTGDATRDIQNMPRWISDWLKIKFVKKITKNRFKDYKKIYIDRSDSVSNIKSLRGIINENELKENLVKKGFKIVKPGSLSFIDQVNLFNESNEVIGLHGAGFANICFCRPGSKVIEIMSHTAGKAIEDLAKKNKLVYKPLKYTPIDNKTSNQFGHIKVSLKDLNEVLENDI
tara:strand:- start:1379 stop:2512 length:1134 start_codon:yes stop_codon:yes gene_type:complete